MSILPENKKTDSRETAIDSLSTAVSPANNINKPILFEYFVKEDKITLIKRWTLNFKDDSLSAFLEILEVLLQISGSRIDILKTDIDVDNYDIILEKFQAKLESAEFDPPITRFLKDKNNLIPRFMDDLSSAMISCGAILSNNYKTFRQWLKVFNNCKIRIIRLTTTYFICSLYESLSNSISHDSSSLSHLKQRQISDSDPECIRLMTELKTFELAASHLFTSCLSFRSRDLDSSIRDLSIISLGKAASISPLFCQEDRLRPISHSLSDTISKNRRDALRAISTIVQEQSGSISQIMKDICSSNFSRILEMCNDTDNSVSASALECLYFMSECGILPSEVDCSHAFELLADASQVIRASAAKFVLQFAFKGQQINLNEFVQFCKKFQQEDLPGVVSSLYPHLKCIRKWSLICDSMMSQVDDENNRILALILQYSCEKAAGKLFDASCDTKNDRQRKMTIVLTGNLPRLLKAFQSDDITVIALISAAHLINLDVVAESGLNYAFGELLSQLRDLFISSSSKEVFNEAIASLYALASCHHPLAEDAKAALDRLAVECSNISPDFISKFAAAAHYVDVSDNLEIRQELILKLTSKLEDWNAKINITECLDCLRYFYEWDIKHLANIRNNPKDNSEEILVESINNFQLYFDIFCKYLQHKENLSKDEFIEAYKGTATLLALSSFLLKEPLMELKTADFIDEKNLSVFCSFVFHPDSRPLINFTIAALSVVTVDPGFTVYFMMLYGISDFQPKIKAAFKNLIKLSPFSGRLFLKALTDSQKYLSPDLIKIGSRYILGKIRAKDIFIELIQFGENLDEILPYIIPHANYLKKEDVIDLKDSVHGILREILEKVENGEKINSKFVSSEVTKKKPQLDIKIKQIDKTDLELDEPDESFVK